MRKMPTLGADSPNGISFKCSTTICYAVNSPTWQTIFEDLQKALNKVGGTVGFAPLKVDGFIGAQTMTAWNKAVAFFPVLAGSQASTLASMATLAPLRLTKLKAILAAPTTATVATIQPAVPQPATGGGITQPASDGVVPLEDKKANDASKKLPWPYYAATVLGAGVVLFAAYHWASKPPTSPRVVLSPALHGRRGR